MGIFKKSVVLAAVLLLAACGESKITKIDGTSDQTLQHTFRQVVGDIHDPSQILQWDLDLKMLRHRYPDGEYLKVLDGKTIEGMKPLIVEAHTFFLKEHRGMMLRIEQEQLDAEKAKLDGITAQPDSNLKVVMLSQQEARVRMYTKSRDELAALTDEQFVKIYGDGASFSDYVRPTAKY
ncbi:hypothetical protein V0M98_37590 (plasmid) [Pseudomonas silesiensis]|uniref:hypothetical protein n=1 Tax=Pseudomonas silesiensis TaxID=1853130 RepID=UPI0030CDE8FD